MQPDERAIYRHSPSRRLLDVPVVVTVRSTEDELPEQVSDERANAGPDAGGGVLLLHCVWGADRYSLRYFGWESAGIYRRLPSVL